MKGDAEDLDGCDVVQVVMDVYDTVWVKILPFVFILFQLGGLLTKLRT